MFISNTKGYPLDFSTIFGIMEFFACRGSEPVCALAHTIYSSWFIAVVTLQAKLGDGYPPRSSTSWYATQSNGHVQPVDLCWFVMLSLRNWAPPALNPGFGCPATSSFAPGSVLHVIRRWPAIPVHHVAQRFVDGEWLQRFVDGEWLVNKPWWKFMRLQWLIVVDNRGLTCG